MEWKDLAFFHWPVPPATLQPLVPPGLELDTWNGSAWVGVVPFRMTGVRVRGAPPVPTAHAFPEINVRTYVRASSRAGVWFVSLDAASRLAVRGARLLFNLPYFDAVITVRRAAHEVSYESRRVHRGAPAAEFRARYRGTGDASEPVPATLEHFLVERYCLFTHDPRRGLGILEVDHPPWQLRRGLADLTCNTMASAAGIDLPGTPLVHVAEPVSVRAWRRRLLEGA
jgi:uncharacterized protein YqjF (DUF2071 family)